MRLGWLKLVYQSQIALVVNDYLCRTGQTILAKSCQNLPGTVLEGETGNLVSLSAGQHFSILASQLVSYSFANRGVVQKRQTVLDIL